MEITVGKLLSLLVAAGYLIGFLCSPGASVAGFVTVGFYLLFPLGLIWFPEELGSMTGYVGHGGVIDTETPPILVSIFGWLILVGVPLLIFFFGE